eukprot:3775551-Pyramimonas_sp.AAC.1
MSIAETVDISEHPSLGLFGCSDEAGAQVQVTRRGAKRKGVEVTSKYAPDARACELCLLKANS